MACTEWADSPRATSVPEATTRSNASSPASSQATGTGASPTPPSVRAGSMTTRVHRTTDVSFGSPEATPRANGSPSSSGTGGRVVAATDSADAPSPPSSELHAAPSAPAPISAAPRRNRRRVAARSSTAGRSPVYMGLSSAQHPNAAPHSAGPASASGEAGRCNQLLVGDRIEHVHTRRPPGGPQRGEQAHQHREHDAGDNPQPWDHQGVRQ